MKQLYFFGVCFWTNVPRDIITRKSYAKNGCGTHDPTHDHHHGNITLML